MEAPQPSSDPADVPADEAQKVRGSRSPNLGPWVIVLLILIVAAAAYVASTL